MKTIGIVLTLLASSLSLGGVEPSASGELLKSVDAYRNPFDSFSVDVEVTSFRKAESETRQYRVYGKGNDHSLVEFVSPAGEQGKYLLMLREAMYIYLPNTSKPIRISPLQRLMGEASNADIARSSYSVDYESGIAGEDNVEGRTAIVLELKATDPQLSYSRIRLLVAKDTHVPLNADYYALSGKLMKRVTFKNLAKVNGRPLLTTVEIQDAVRPDHRTVMRYSELRSKQIPDKMFNKDYLGKW